MTTDLGSAVLNRCPPAQPRHLDHRGVGLIMLSMGGQQIGTRSPIGKLMVTMLAAIAELERGISLEWQREGVAEAKADGKNKGRKPTARAKAAEVIRLDADGFGGPRSHGGSASAWRPCIGFPQMLNPVPRRPRFPDELSARAGTDRQRSAADR